MQNPPSLFPSQCTPCPTHKNKLISPSPSLLPLRPPKPDPRQPTSLDKQPAYRRWIVQKIVYNVFLKYPVESQISQYATLSHTNLDWTMVMPPMLTNGGPRGHYRIDPDALPRNGARIARADVASFMLQQLITTQYSRKGVYITW